MSAPTRAAHHGLLALLLLLLTLPTTGCRVVGGIFKAGFVTAIVAVIVIIALVAFLGRGRH